MEKQVINDATVESMGTGTGNPEQDLKILHERALALSRLQDNGHKEHTDSLYVVKFMLSGEVYCIEAELVSEVLPLKELAVIPCTPPFIVGIINIRGQVFTVLNLKKVFNLSERGISEFNKVMIVCHENISFGIVADAIIGTQYIGNAAINQVLYSTKSNEFITGVTSEGLIVLDGKALIKSKELVVNQKQNKDNKF
ncbi:MAG: chemotaxis protein CheW [Bacteroidota bacterium]|nr:chemotaxis protein CheW [Bacteroidota bacterium]